MSLESAQAFYKDVTAGKVKIDLSKMVNSEPAAAMTYAHSHGYDFTESEMLEALKHNGKSITMTQAEAVAGGDASTWTGAGASAVAGGAACA